MIALLRYAIVKSWRDRTLAASLLAPAVMIFAPLMTIGLLGMATGNTGFPFVYAPRNPYGTAATFISGAAVIISTLSAGVSAFLIFRVEVATRSIGLFFLSGHTRAVSAAATIYGTFAGIVSYALAMLVAIGLTFELPNHLGRDVAVLVVASCAASAAAALMVALSADTTMLVPVYAAGATLSIALLQMHQIKLLAITLAAALAVATIAPIVLRRTCGA